MLTTAFTEQELDQLEFLLSSDIFNDEAMTLDTLQGFLCAVASGPEPIPPSTWLPEILGETIAEDSSHVQETIGLLMRFYDSIVAGLADNGGFDLILYGQEDDPEKLDYAAWCDGYIYGSQIGELNWFEAAGEYAADLSEKMEGMFLLNGMLKEDALKHKEPWLNAKEEQKALTEAEENLPDAIGALFHFWLSLRTPQTPVRRASSKVGRNVPCPCGSGKKFKECCGKEQLLH